MAVTASPALANFYNDAAGFQVPMGGLSSNSVSGLSMNDGGPLSLGSALAVAGGASLYNYGDTSNFGASWEYLYSTSPTSIFNLPNTSLSPTLSFGSDSSVYSTEESDLLLMGSEGDEFLQHINGCSPITMHPNLVSTLKNMVTPGAVTYSAQSSVLDRLEQLNRLEQQQHEEPGHVHESLRNVLLRQYCLQTVVPKVELPDLSPAIIGAVVPCTVTDTEEPSKVYLTLLILRRLSYPACVRVGCRKKICCAEMCGKLTV